MAYIEKEKIIDFITKGLNNPNKEKAFGHDAIEILAEIQYTADADVRPVMYGHWVIEKDLTGRPRCFHCSVCDDEFQRTDVKVVKPYCPDCGAKMDTINIE